MQEPQDPEEKEGEVAPVVEPAPRAPRFPIIVGWLRPLVPGPATTKAIAQRIEWISGVSARAIPVARTSGPPYLLSFILLVLAPSVAAAVYFLLLASDQYVVESKFAVRSVEVEMPQMETGGGAPTSSSGFSFTAAGQNAYIVTSYIQSRAIVDDIDQKLNLREIFRRPEADFWARLNKDASIDELTEYWRTMVDAYVDSVSGIVTIKLRAFRRDDGLALGRAVVETSEALVNRISQRARRDATSLAETEVRKSFEDVQKALADLHSFRDTAGIIDPGQTMTEIAKLLMPLLSDKIKIESDLFVATREMSENAPTVNVLRGKLESVEARIKELKARVTNTTGGADPTVASSLSKFEELEIQRQMAERFYGLAQAELNRAQLRADRQNVYLSVFEPPSLPEEARYPRRFAYSFLAFVSFLVLWGIGAMIAASVEDHRL
jgi:capsular polysaccharide transport system permease protein